MVNFITVIFFTFVGASSANCPLQYIIPTLEVKQMSGKWYEYKKTTNFLTSAVCTTFDVSCAQDNDTACNVTLNPNGTNTGWTTTLLSNTVSTHWTTDVIYLYVNTTAQFSIFWNCSDKEIPKYELLVLMKNISDENTAKDIDELLEDLSKKYSFETEAVNNTLCSGGKRSAINNIALTMLLLVSAIFTQINY